MKRLVLLLLALTVCACLWACSEEAAEDPGETTASPVEDTWEGPTPMDEAMEFVGCPVEELLDRLGPPARIEFFPSPMSEEYEETIEEGYYYYDGFTVVTLKEGESEIVYYVDGSQD